MKRRDILLVLSGFLIALAIGVVVRLLSPEDSGSKSVYDGPLIGIASLANDSYGWAIREAGGIPVVLPISGGGPSEIRSYLNLVDGLVMPGGADIPPSEWGEKPHPTTNLLSDDRYRFEKELVTRWIQETEKPLLGICLGCQWINVAQGGSLVQDIPSEFDVSHRDRDHLVELEANSRLGRILGETSLEVNSFHHQAVREIGSGLRIVARCPDGIVEAVETLEEDRFMIGVQWHPEGMVEEDDRQKKLFRAFVESAAEFQRARRR